MANQQKSRSRRLDEAKEHASNVRFLWFTAAFVLFAVATIAAVIQPPRPNAYESVTPAMRDWWLYPHEQNAPMRVSRMFGQVIDVLCSPDGSVVWALGRKGVIYRYQFGIWKQYTIPVADDYSAPTRLVFAQRDSVSTLSPDGSLNRTRDGGKTWNPPLQVLNKSRYQIVDVSLVGSTAAYALYKGMYKPIKVLVYSSDSGRTWSTTALDSKVLAVSFASPKTGWTVSSDGTLSETADGGAHWNGLTSDLAHGVAEAEGRGAHGTATVFAAVLSNVDDVHGCLSANGTLFTTDSGGRHWKRRGPIASTVPLSTVSSIEFVSATHGFMLGYSVDLGSGSNPVLLESTDGGARWITVSTPGGLFDLAFGGLARFNTFPRGVLCGQLGNVLLTTDGAKSWTPLTRETDYVGICRTNESGMIWICGSDGRLASSSDNGKTWTPRATPVRSILTDVCFPDRDHGWCVGLGGVVLVTANGGRTWTAQASGTSEDFQHVSFMDQFVGCAAGPAGVRFTRDGGHTWSTSELRPSKLRPSARLTGIDDLELFGGRGYLSASGFLFTTQDGGRTWNIPLKSVPNAAIYPVFSFWDVGHGVALYSGGIATTSDGGLHWVSKSAANPHYTGDIWDSCAFVDERNGGAIEDGTLYSTADGGQTWTPHPEVGPFVGWLRASGRSIWAFGFDGVLAASFDGGLHWSDPRVYRRFVAPWYFLSFIVILPMFWLGLRPPGVIELGGSTIADAFSTDRPLRQGDYDAMQFQRLAAGLSRYLRNENTRAPLTLAITGEWGSGKSSIMNLLQADLQRYGIRSVWFNAWHHQEEEHLLAALLESIQRQALPSTLTWAGLAFRSNLLLRRTRAWYPLILVSVFTLALAVAFFIHNPAEIDVAEDQLGTVISTHIAPAAPTGPTAMAGNAQVSLTWAPSNGASSYNIYRGTGSGAESATAIATGITATVYTNIGLTHGTAYYYRVAAVNAGGTSAQSSEVSASPLSGASSRNAPAGNSDETTEPQTTGDAGTDTASWAVVLSLLTLFGTAVKALSAFGLKPGELLTSLSKQARVSDLQAQTSFRYRFAKEFADVTAALNPRTMVIFIDDLDRCKPANVVITLEAINFLVSSGECFVVLGMARSIVEHSVALDFKDVAAEMAYSSDTSATGGSSTAEDAARAQRLQYARRYLEKIINLEVPVPPPSEHQTGTLLSQPERVAHERRKIAAVILRLVNGRIKSNPGLLAAQARSKEGGFIGRFVFSVRRGVVASGVWLQTWTVLLKRRLSLTRTRLAGLSNALPAVVILLMIATGSGLGYWAPGKTLPAPRPRSPSNLPSNLPSTPAGSPAAPATPSQSVPSSGSDASDLNVTDGVSWKAPLYGVAAVIVLLAFLGWIRMRVPPDVIVKDSTDFKDALDDWRKFLFRPTSTPRRLKRFVNRVRFYAMRQPVQSSRRLGLILPGLRDKGAPKRAAVTSTGLPEDILVALSAIEYFHPDWVSDPELYEDFQAYFVRHASEEEMVGFLKPNSTSTEVVLPAFSRGLKAGDRAAFLTLSSSLNGSSRSVPDAVTDQDTSASLR
ncbi:MAG: YCF48-related protein [Capsulimonadaceae bacterium]